MKSVTDIMNLMKDIKYGYCWVDKTGKRHYQMDNSFSYDYILQSPDEVLASRVGICWDQVELERYYFEKLNIKTITYFICHYDNDRCPSHTFLTYKENDKFYWFEHSWEIYRGIHEFDSMKDLLKEVREKFIITELSNNYSESNLLLREYSKPEYGISIEEFYKHCEINTIINIDML